MKMAPGGDILKAKELQQKYARRARPSIFKIVAGGPGHTQDNPGQKNHFTPGAALAAGFLLHFSPGKPTGERPFPVPGHFRRPSLPPAATINST
jgi:hypothetical protein